MPSTTLYLVRHGEQDTTSSPATDPGLSARGTEQAERLARHLSGAGVHFDALHHSSLPRATQTAQILARHLPPVPVHACELVKDRTPIPESYPVRYQDFFDAVPEEERDPGALRLSQAVEHLSRTDQAGPPERTDLIVTHNFVIGWFVRHVMQAPRWRWLGLNQANCAITVLRWETGIPPTMLSFNETSHLQGVNGP